MPRTKGATALLCAVLVALVALPYLPGLNGSFIFDDYPNISQQPAIRATSLTWDELRSAIGAFSFGTGRPLPMLSLAVDHAIWGTDTFGYKLTNLIIHLVNTLLVFVLARAVLGLARPQDTDPTSPAFLVAFVWAVHPLQVSTVLYVIQRMETLSAGFVILSLLGYLSARKRQIQGAVAWPIFGLSLVFAGIGISTKESAILVPAYALAIELTIFRFRTYPGRTSTSIRAAYGLAIIAGMIIAAALAPHYVSDSTYAIREFNAVERVLTQFRVLPMYLGWIVLPQPGNYVFYYDNFSHSTGLFQPISTALGLAFLLALVGAAFAMRRRNPLFSLGVFWYLSAHAVTSSFLPLELVFEHRNYFAILGVILAGVGLWQSLPYARSPKFNRLLSAVLISGLIALTFIRSSEWGNPLQLAMQLAQNNPGSSRASTDLGEQYMILGRNDASSRYYAMARSEFERGSALPNSSPMPEQGLVVLAAAAGQPAESRWWDSMISKLNRRAIGPQEMSMITGLLRLREQEGLEIDDNRLADAYIVLANRASMPPTQYFAFGMHALTRLGDPDLAGQLFTLTVVHAGGNQELIDELVGHLVAQGYPEAASKMAGYSAGAGIDASSGEKDKSGQRTPGPR